MSYVIYFHDGTMSGDCNEAELKVEDSNITFKKALKLLLSKQGAVENGWDDTEEGVEDFIECNDDCFVGAWIVPAETVKKFEIICGSIEYPGDDSAGYAMQALWKGIYKAFAEKEIGKKAK